MVHQFPTAEVHRPAQKQIIRALWIQGLPDYEHVAQERYNCAALGVDIDDKRIFRISQAFQRLHYSVLCLFLFQAGEEGIQLLKICV